MIACPPSPYRYRDLFIQRSLLYDQCEETGCGEPPVPLDEGRRIVTWPITIGGATFGEARYVRRCRTHHERAFRRLMYVIPHSMGWWLEDNEVQDPPALQRVIPPPADAYP